MLTQTDANARLASIQTVDQLRALLAELDISCPGSVTLLYSGAVPGGTAQDAARLLAIDDPSLRIIGNTEAAKFVDESNTPLMEKLRDLFGDQPTTRGTQANQFLYGSRDAGGTRTPNGAWDIVSGRFAEATTGEVRLIAPAADPKAVFGATELRILLEKGSVTSIEGIPLSELRDTVARNGATGLEAAFNRVRVASEMSVVYGGLSLHQLPEGPLVLEPGDFLDPAVSEAGGSDRQRLGCDRPA